MLQWDAGHVPPMTGRAGAPACRPRSFAAIPKPSRDASARCLFVVRFCVQMCENDGDAGDMPACALAPTDRSVERGTDVEDRKRTIFDTAVRLFKTKGYHATSVKEIADAVGLQKGSLYHYMTGKEDLLDEIARTAISAYLVDLRKVEEEGGSGREMLAHLVRRHVDRVTRDTDTITVLLREAHALSAKAKEEIHALTSRYTDGLVAILGRGVADGSLACADPALAALAILGALNWMTQWYVPGGRLTPGRIAELLEALILEGLRPRT